MHHYRYLCGLLVGWLLLGLLSIPAGVSGFIVKTSPSPHRILCWWGSAPNGMVLPQHATETDCGARVFYQCGAETKKMLCAEYYAEIQATYKQLQAARSPYTTLDSSWTVWLCWYADPCSCEEPRS